MGGPHATFDYKKTSTGISYESTNGNRKANFGPGRAGSQFGGDWIERIKLELLKESPRVEVQSADEQFLMKVKEVIHERLNDEQLSVESLAEDIGLSRVQLYRKVTALTGVSVNELIRTFRLQKAAQLLQQNWGPVSQVAYEVGFSNLSYFSKVFKEEFGVLPSEYK